MWLWGPKEPRDLKHFVGTELTAAETCASSCCSRRSKMSSGCQCWVEWAATLKENYFECVFAVIFSNYSVLVLKCNDCLTDKSAVVYEVNCCPYYERLALSKSDSFLVCSSVVRRLCLLLMRTRGTKNKQNKSENKQHQLFRMELLLVFCIFKEKKMFGRKWKRVSKENCVAAAAPLSCSQHLGGLHKGDIPHGYTINTYTIKLNLL